MQKFNILECTAYANVAEPEFLSSTEIRKKLSISRTTFWRLRKNPDFPASMILFGTLERWKISEIESFIESRKNPRQ